MTTNKLAVAITALFASIAKANHIQVEQVDKNFTVAPAAVQTMYDKIALSNELLQKINLIGKQEQKGEIIGLSTGLIASNTDTTAKGKRREPVSIHNLDSREYLLHKTNFDVALRYDEIDGWAHLTDFPARVNAKVAESIGLSLITMGMNGVKREKTTDLTQYPLLQDVNKGWLQKIREERPQNVMGWATGAVGTTKQEVQYGNGASEYKNLDAVVMDCLNNLIDERFADRNDFVVLASRRTVGDKYVNLLNAAGDKATESEAASRLNKERTLGGLPVMFIPNMPVDTLLITPLKNLSIYYQISGERRRVVDAAEKDQLESYQSKNIDFIVEDYGAAVLVDNLKHVA